MAKPVILVVEPDPEVLWAIKDDVQRQYETLWYCKRTQTQPP